MFPSRLVFQSFCENMDITILSCIAKVALAMKKEGALRVGFEPTREDPNGFQVHRLNHSAIAA